MTDRREGPRWIGAPLPRTEDEPLLNGSARFIDDLAPVPGIRHAALLRSPYAHARIRGIDAEVARTLPGVTGVLTGADLIPGLSALAAAVHAPVEYFPIAGDKVRYVGEPVALVAARDRYRAEDALEAITVDYEPLEAAADLAAAAAPGAALVHEGAGSNEVQRRSFRYGEPEQAFAQADRVVRLAWRYPRQSSTPIETYGAIAHFEPSPERFTIWSNFQGPYILQPLMARALRVPGNRLRLISAPHSGGSFGIKQGLFPYLVLLAAASRGLGAPLKWIEDRLEHLSASSSSAERLDEIEAAFTAEGQLTALRFRNCVNLGAYIRAPEPASVYRMHAASNGCYRVRNIAVDNRLVVSNQAPVGLNRGYGGPQFYYGLERAMDAGARALGLDPAELRRRNFIPSTEFPYAAPAGATYDAGDYATGLGLALELGDYEGLKRRRAEQRSAGRAFGIGLAVGVEPSGSNMAYVTLAQTLEQRAQGGGRSGGAAASTVSIDPSGAITVRLDSSPAGQGHATVAAQLVADGLGVRPEEVQVVTTLDTQTSAWSLASGNYANRFSSIVVGALAESTEQVAWKLRQVAAHQLEVAPEDIELSGGRAHVAGVPAQGVSLGRLAAATHWHPAGLPEGLGPGLEHTAMISPALLDAPDEHDRVASAVTFGSLCDLVALEVDRDTGRIHIHTYATVHDVGRVLNPLIAEGQIRGGFAHGIGAALLEDLTYDSEGNFLAGTFADYPCPTATEIPPLRIGHHRTLSPHSRLGSKGMGDGSSMLTPAAIANAVADALGREDVQIPLTLDRTWRLANGSFAAMKPSAFDYLGPETVEEALAGLAEYGDDALVLAGGLSLGPMLNMRVACPAAVVDINRVPDLAALEAGDPGWLRTGALVRQARAMDEDQIREQVPLLAKALPHVGHYQTRARGTLGGSTCHADPSAEIPLCLITLGGRVELRSVRGTRTLEASAFIESALTTAREGDELLSACLWPRHHGGTAFCEISQRHGDFAIVAAAAEVHTEHGALRYRLGLGGVEDRPRVTEGLLEPGPNEESLREALERAVSSLEPMDDPQASAAFRAHLARSLGLAALRAARDDQEGEPI